MVASPLYTAHLSELSQNENKNCLWLTSPSDVSGDGGKSVPTPSIATKYSETHSAMTSCTWSFVDLMHLNALVCSELSSCIGITVNGLGLWPSWVLLCFLLLFFFYFILLVTPPALKYSAHFFKLWWIITWFCVKHNQSGAVAQVPLEKLHHVNFMKL